MVEWQVWLHGSLEILWFAIETNHSPGIINHGQMYFIKTIKQYCSMMQLSFVSIFIVTNPNIQFCSTAPRHLLQDPELSPNDKA